MSTESLEIYEVDLVQTEANDDEEGTLFIELCVDDHDVTRIYRNFPVPLYEAWLESDFAVDMYLAEIEAAYPCVEENDEEEE